MPALASRRGRAYGGLVGLRLVAVLFDAHDPLRLARFWSGLLDRPVVENADGTLLPGDGTQLGLGFVLSPAEKLGPSRMHVHLTSASASEQQRTVARALTLGGRHLDVGQLPEEEHVVLADPEGNELCVIPAGNAFLDGCGFLGELAGEGTRTVGRFWSAALGWPLVWDEDEETAVQSPRGGTKLAWGGPPVAPVNTLSRQQHLALAPDGEPAAEVDRLVSIGATHVRTRRDGGAVLADPDGNAFLVWPSEPGF